MPPPVGLNLYVASGITKMGITRLTVAVWPWLLSMLGFLVVVTYWPALSIWLPRPWASCKPPQACLTGVRGETRRTPLSRKKGWKMSLAFFLEITTNCGPGNCLSG